MRPPDDPIDTDKKKRNSVKGSLKQHCHVYELPKRAKMIAAGGACNAAVLEDESLVTLGMGCNGQLARSANMTEKRMMMMECRSSEKVFI